MRRILRDDRHVEQVTSSIRDNARDVLKAARESLVQAGGRLRAEDFDRDVYSDPRIREHLWKTQDAKCAYCEKDLELSYQHVDHFRPKTTARRTARTTTEGYWWLAYELSNLLLSCPDCNVSKSDWFPLLRGSPSGSADSGVGSERPALVDPLREDPARHLTFVQLPNGAWRIAGTSSRGWTTIERLHLDRDSLDRLRHKTAKDAALILAAGDAQAATRFVDPEKCFSLLRRVALAALL